MFSELVDDIVTASGRTDKLVEIISMTNAILRRIHAKEHFERDLVTTCVVPDPNKCVQGAVVWKRPKDLKVVRTAKTGPKYLRYEKLGRQLEGRKFFYYAEGEYFVFQTGHTGLTVDIAYYRKPKIFCYFPADKRPAVWDKQKDEWSYLIPSTTGQFAPQLMSDVDQDCAQAQVHDWVLEEYPTAVMQGVLNLLYVQLGDERAGGTFAVHNELMKDIVRNEAHASTNN